MTKDSRTKFTAEPGKQQSSSPASSTYRGRRCSRCPWTQISYLCGGGPKRFTTKVDKMDVRPGGVWRFLHLDAEGNEYAFHGVYHDILPNERIVDTFEFEGMPGHVSLETMTLEEQDGKTKLTTRSVFQSVEDRDGMVGSDMEEGVAETMDRLAALVEKSCRLVELSISGTNRLRDNNQRG